MTLWYSSMSHEVMACSPVYRVLSAQSQLQEGIVMSKAKPGSRVRWAIKCAVTA